MSRQFVVPNINEITSSYGTGSNFPIVLEIPGVLSIKKNEPYRVIVDKK